MLDAIVAVLVLAHHIMGIPHYAYDENYPQAPVLKLVETVGRWEFQLTGYPGNPEPGNRTQINVYVVDVETREIYRQPISLEIHRLRPFGDPVTIFGPRSANLEENVFKFYPTYPVEGNFDLTLSFDDGSTISTLRFPMVVGEPGSPWTVIAWFVGGLAVFVVGVRAVRIKRARRQAATRAVERETPA